MKWWALEILWLAAYAFRELGGRLAADAQAGTVERELERDPDLLLGREALAHAAAIIEYRESLTWPESSPHPRDSTVAAKEATKAFLAALGWIQQHEAKHIIIDREPLAGDDVAEERACDAHATGWLLDGRRDSSELRQGTTVALFFLVLREAISGEGPSTHPSASERVESSRITQRHAGWLAMMIEVLLQSGGHPTPGTARNIHGPLELLAAELGALKEALKPANSKGDNLEAGE